LDASDDSEAELLLRVAVWGAAAECQLKPDLLMRAAAAARTRSLDSAVHLLRAALSVGAPPQAFLELALILTGQGRIDEAAAALADFGREGLTPAERVSGCVTLAMGLVWTLHRPDLALTMLAEQRASGIGEPALTGLLDAAEAAAHLIKGDVRLAEQFGSRALTTPMAEDVMLVQSATVVCVARANGGRPQSGSELALLWEEAGQRVRTTAPQLAAGLLAARWSALELTGEIDTLAAESRVAFRKAVEEGDDFLRTRAAQSLARVSLHGARPRRAVEFMREVLVGLSGFDRMFTGWNLALLAETLAVAGETEEARIVLTRCDQHEPIAGLFASDRFRAEAAVLACEGQLSKAAAIAASGARDAAAHGMMAQASRCWFDAARFGHADANRELGRMSSVEGAFAPLWGRHAMALARHDGYALDASADAFAAISAHLWAAEAGMEAALAHERNGKSAEAVASFERAQSLLDPADPVATPALRAARTVTTLLTAREREVAHLAARGLADRAIAEQLEVSVRTVETHLTRAYSKLGVQGRTDLTSVFREIPSQRGG
jgi:DNA-binding CsgD family transcriptional regulator